MALIKCPECGKEISDKAPACIYCGYPLHLQAETTAPSSGNGLQQVILDTNSVSPEKKIVCIKVVRESNGMGLAEASNLVGSPNTAVVKGNLTKMEAEKIAQNFLKIGVKAYVCAMKRSETTEVEIICPKCGSTAIHAGPRGYSLLTGIIGSGKTIITCLHCGYKWKPGK